MTKAKRKITKFDFTSEGAHCALVDAAANKQQVLVMKSTKASEEEIKKAVVVNLTLNLLEFLTRYLGLYIDEAEMVAGMLDMNFDDLYQEEEISSFEDMVQRNLDKVQVNKSEASEKFVESFSNYLEKYSSKASSSVEDGEAVNKSTEDKTDKPKEESKAMTDKVEVTQENLEEQINKAAESIVAKRLEEIEKAANEKVEAVSKELEIFKAREDAREKQEYLAKAESLAKYLGEEADKEAIAKALMAIEKSEESKPMLDVLKALKDFAEKEDEGLFEEIGKSATKDQPTDFETKVEAVQKSLMDEKGLSESAAYVQAYDQVRAEK